eukprot:2226717-Pleurochrysis_carterae.AAC.1
MAHAAMRARARARDRLAAGSTDEEGAASSQSASLLSSNGLSSRTRSPSPMRTRRGATWAGSLVARPSENATCSRDKITTSARLSTSRFSREVLDMI